MPTSLPIRQTAHSMCLHVTDFRTKSLKSNEIQFKIQDRPLVERERIKGDISIIFSWTLL